MAFGICSQTSIGYCEFQIQRKIWNNCIVRTVEYCVNSSVNRIVAKKLCNTLFIARNRREFCNSSDFSKAILLLWIICVIEFMSCVCHAFVSVHCCLVVIYWERADLLALVCDV